MVAIPRSNRVLPLLTLAAVLAGWLTACDGGDSGDRSALFSAFPAPGQGSTFREMGGVSQGLPWGSSEGAVARRREILGEVTSMGIHRMRMDLAWASLEKEPGVWNFERIDPMVADCEAWGVKIVGLLAYSNHIYPNTSFNPAGTDDHYPTLSPAPYVDYAETLVRRFSPTIREWELWNEPNNWWRFWKSGADAGMYIRQSRPAVEAGRAACPDCTFLVGSLSYPLPVPYIDIIPEGPTYLRDMFEADRDLGSWADGISYHPYQYPKDPPEYETAPFPDRFQGSFQTQAGVVREIVSSYGPAMPLWVTENGWPTNPDVPATDAELEELYGIPAFLFQLARLIFGDEVFRAALETFRGVSEENQARYLVRSLLLASELGIVHYDIYNLDDCGNRPEVNQECAFGLRRPDRSEKPAAQAVRHLLTTFPHHRFSGNATGFLGLSEPCRALAFRFGDSLCLALWRWKDGQETVWLRGLPEPTRLTDMYGSGVGPVARDGGDFALTLGPDVTYVEFTRP